MKRFLFLAGILLHAVPSAADNIINDDLIVNGSICSGIDCVSGENFAFDTLIIKENNLRILFNDTSSSSSFPRTDWRLIMNDSSNGGLEHFTIENADSGVFPFSIFADAPHQALVVDAGGVGLGIDPQRTLHVAAADTPTIRVEQTGELGWASQVWDIGANESNLFMRDSTSGSLPFRILPASHDNTLVLAAAGHIGVGTESPQGTLHLFSTDAFDISGTGVGQLVIENGLGADAVMLNIRNDGAVVNVYEDLNTASRWQETFGPDPAVASGRAWVLREAGGPEAVAVTHDGQMRISGSLTQGSSRYIKHQFSRVHAQDVLEALSELEISRWQYRTEVSGGKHMGPMAEDFHAAFGLGVDNKHISPGDMAAVALASVQAVRETINDQSSEIRQLKVQVGGLESRLARLESLLAARP